MEWQEAIAMSDVGRAVRHPATRWSHNVRYVRLRTGEAWKFWGRIGCRRARADEVEGYSDWEPVLPVVTKQEAAQAKGGE